MHKIALGYFREPPVAARFCHTNDRNNEVGSSHACQSGSPPRVATRFGLATCRAVGLAKAEARQRSTVPTESAALNPPQWLGQTAYGYLGKKPAIALANSVIIVPPPWPSVSTTINRLLLQRWCSCHAVCRGELTSKRPWIKTPGRCAIRPMFWRISFPSKNAAFDQ